MTRARRASTWTGLCPPRCAGSHRRVHLNRAESSALGADNTTELRDLTRLAQPTVVFQPGPPVRAFSNDFTIDIIEEGEIVYRTAYGRDLRPADTTTGARSGWSVCTPFVYPPN